MLNVLSRINFMAAAFVCSGLAAVAAGAETLSVGVIDRHGIYTIPPKYKQIHYLGFGFFKCFEQLLEYRNPASKDKFEILDRNGKPSTNASFAAARAAKQFDPQTELWNKREKKLSDGLVIFRTESRDPKDKHGFILVQGNPQKMPRREPTTFEHPWRFGYKDSHGKVVIAAKYFEVQEFSEGLAAVRINSFADTAEYCFIDRKGRRVSPIYWRAQKFIDGLAAVAVNDNTAVPYPGNFIGSGRFGKYGVIDRSFKFVIQPKYYWLKRLSKSLYFAVPVSGEKSQFLDIHGRVVTTLPMRYSKAEKISDNRYQINDPFPNTGDGPSAIFVDSEGKIVGKQPAKVDLLASDLDTFIGYEHSNNYVKDWEQGQALLFKSKGGEIRRVKFNRYSGNPIFKNGLAVLTINDAHIPFYKQHEYRSLQGVLDIHGNWVIPPERSEFEVVEASRIIKKIYKN